MSSTKFRPADYANTRGVALCLTLEILQKQFCKNQTVGFTTLKHVALFCSRFGDDHLLNEFQDQQDEIDFSGNFPDIG